MFERMCEGKYSSTFIEKICCGCYRNLIDNGDICKQGMQQISNYM